MDGELQFSFFFNLQEAKRHKHTIDKMLLPQHIWLAQQTCKGKCCSGFDCWHNAAVMSHQGYRWYRLKWPFPVRTVVCSRLARPLLATRARYSQLNVSFPLQNGEESRLIGQCAVRMVTIQRIWARVRHEASLSFNLTLTPQYPVSTFSEITY